MREYRKKNPDKMKSIDLKKNFGISLQDYKYILEKQSNTCAICRLPETSIDHRTKMIRKLAVDHDHFTGEVRGLLCSKCNVGLGQFQDDTELLLSAVAYLSGA